MIDERMYKLMIMPTKSFRDGQIAALEMRADMLINRGRCSGKILNWEEYIRTIELINFLRERGKNGNLR